MSVLEKKLNELDTKMDYVVQLLESLVGDTDLSNGDGRAEKMAEAVEQQRQLLGNFMKQANMKNTDQVMDLFANIMKTVSGDK